MKNLDFLLAGFSVVWIGIFLFLLRIDGRTRRAEDDLADLRRRLGRDEGDRESSSRT